MTDQVIYAKYNDGTEFNRDRFEDLDENEIIEVIINGRHLDEDDEIDITFLEDLHNLQKLGIQFLQLSEDGFEFLKYLKDLKELSLYDLYTIDLKLLQNCLFLQKLDLNNCYLDKLDLSPLKHCTQLISLDLYKCNLKKLDLLPLKHCKKLESLNIGRNKLIEIDLEPLSHCKNLSFLYLTGNKFRVIDGTPIINLHNLNEFNISRYVKIEVRSPKNLSTLPDGIYRFRRRINWIDCNPKYNERNKKDKKYDSFSLDKYTNDFITEIKNILIQKKQLILYGPPGTGKTHLALGLAQELTESLNDYKVVQFHPSLGYEDFVEGLSIKTAPDNKNIFYEEVPKTFRQMCDIAKNLEDEEYAVLVIDEINRGDLGRIFGELILGLEYRDLPIRTQYLSNPLIIPENLLIIGTMNSVDRSIAIVDFALRRRFQFIECMPDAMILEKWLEENCTDDQLVERIIQFFNRLNEEITNEESRLGPHHQIGHTFFFVERKKDMERNWKYMIKPLLEEYLNFNRVALQPYIDILNEFLE